MILESFLVLGVIGIILTFFYRQAVQEFRILQTESLEKAMNLLYERCPIVVLPVSQPPPLWTRDAIGQRPTLSQLIIQGHALKNLLDYESVPFSTQVAEHVATQVGLPIWVKQTLLPEFQRSTWWTPILWSTTHVYIGAQGLRQTYGYSTLLLSTEGALQVSLLNESSDAYLPANWSGKRVSKLTKDEAPLLNQIQYVDVIVRPGSALLIPPHWKVCWETLKETKPSLAVWIEFHHPVSHFVKAASLRKFSIFSSSSVKTAKKQ